MKNNIPNNIEDLLQQAGSSVRLSDTEKNTQRTLLMTHIEQKKKQKWYTAILHAQTTRFVVAPLTICLLVVTGVSASSLDAYPGDILYGIKTNIVEPVVALVQFSDEAEVLYEKKLTERRLDEVLVLAARNTLNDVDKESLVSEAERHLTILSKSTETLSPEFAVEILSDTEATLRAYEKLFSRVDEKETTDILSSHVAILNKKRLTNEMQISGSYVKKEDAEKKSQDIKEFLALVQGGVDLEGQMQGALEAQAQLRLAEEALHSGEENISAGSYTQAMLSFSRASRFIREAQVVFNTGVYLAIRPQTVERATTDSIRVNDEAPVAIAIAPIKKESSELVNEATMLSKQVTASFAQETSMVSVEVIDSEDVYEIFKTLIKSNIGNYEITPVSVMKTFPGVRPEDFNNVNTEHGVYIMTEIGLLLQANGSLENDNTEEISEAGERQLLLNIALRLKVEFVTRTDVEYIVGIIKIKESSIETSLE